MCRGVVGGSDIITDYRWYLCSFHGAIDENGGHSASVDFLGCPAQFTAFACGRRYDYAVNSMLEERSGMIQLILYAFIGIAYNYLAAVSPNGCFDGSYDPGEERVANVSDDEADGKR